MVLLLVHDWCFIVVKEIKEGKYSSPMDPVGSSIYTIYPSFGRNIVLANDLRKIYILISDIKVYVYIDI